MLVKSFSSALSLLGIDVTALESDSTENDEAVKKVASSIVSKIIEMKKRRAICKSRINIQITKLSPTFNYHNFLHKYSLKRSQKNHYHPFS